MSQAPSTAEKFLSVKQFMLTSKSKQAVNEVLVLQPEEEEKAPVFERDQDEGKVIPIGAPESVRENSPACVIEESKVEVQMVDFAIEPLEKVHSLEVFQVVEQPVIAVSSEMALCEPATE